MSCRKAQQGGAAIIVAFSLLVLILVASTGLAQNTLRQSLLSGISLQGLGARNTADAGLEWGVFWLDEAPIADAGSGASQYQDIINRLLVNPGLAGGYQNLPAGTFGDMILKESKDIQRQYYDMQLMYMGRVSVGIVSANLAPPDSPVAKSDLWSVRAEGHNVLGGVMDFEHAKEAWVSTRARSVDQ